MLEGLEGKEVTIVIGSGSFTQDVKKGKALKVSQNWLKLQAKNKVTYINLELVSSITVEA